MKNFFKKYLFVFEFLGVAIILAVGIFAVAKPSIFLYIVGLALIIFGAFRVIPLVKTTKDKWMKLIYTVEIVINIVAGVLLVLEGGKDPYNENLMRYLVGGVLYLRGFLYFFATVIRGESTDHVKFFTHIAVITLGPIIIINNIFNEKVLSWIVLVMAILSAIFISISGIKNYKNYRYEQLAKDETRKSIKKQKEKEVEEDVVPMEDPLPTKDPVIIPEEEKRDEAIS